MALINCHECGKPVSTEAKKCPACGATVKLPKPPKKPTSKLVWGFLAVLVIGMFMLSAEKRADSAAADKAEADRVAAMTPEQRDQAKAQREKQDAANKVQKDKQDAVEKAQKDKESQTLALALMGAKTLKQSSKDPQTFEFTSIVTQPNSTVCYEYRAKNSFNAMLAGAAVLSKGKLLVHERDGSFVPVWNKNCTPAGGTEVMSLVVRVLESS
ncbi:MAG TPA: zinc ribbon domain-containing protein [Rhodoferax sp.]